MIQQDESIDYSTEKVEIPHTASFVDPNDEALFVGKRPLSDIEKIKLLTSMFNCPTNFVFPATSGRRLPFASTGFNKWKKTLGSKSSLLEKHNASEVHKLAEEKTCLFIRNQRQPSSDIASIMARETKLEQIRTIKGILSIIDVVIALGMRGIAFRGNWDKVTKAEDRNFSYFVNWKSQFDGDLREHLHKAARNAKYTSPVVQNTIISLCENAIREKVLAMFSSSYWSLMADETEDVSNMEQVSVCARFVHNYEVYEEFLGFVTVAKMDAQTIADELHSTLKQCRMSSVECS